MADFQHLPEAVSLATAHKRITNILRKCGDASPGAVDEAALQEEAERQLAKALARLTAEVEPLLARQDYAAALSRLAALREPVDRFFDEVMVMVDEPVLRANRLALLNALRHLFLRVADLACLQHAGR